MQLVPLCLFDFPRHAIQRLKRLIVEVAEIDLLFYQFGNLARLVLKNAFLDRFVQPELECQRRSFDGRHGANVFHQRLFLLGVWRKFQVSVRTNELGKSEHANVVDVGGLSRILDVVLDRFLNVLDVGGKQGVIEAEAHFDAIDLTVMSFYQQRCRRRCHAVKAGRYQQATTLLDFCVSRSDDALVAFGYFDCL